MQEIPESKLYDSLLDIAKVPRGSINRELLKKKLNVKPLKSKYMVYESCFMWQCDLKHVPINASGIQYILVCVDVSTRKCDAQQLFTTEDIRNISQISRNTLSIATFDAFRDIVARKLICDDAPKLLYVDGGPEFEAYFKRRAKYEFDIKIRTTVRGRKQQNAIVEHTNELIGFGLMNNAYRLRTEGLLPNSEPRPMERINIFADNILPKIVTRLNEWASGKFPLPAKEWFKFDFDYPVSDIKEGDYIFIPKTFTERIRQRSGQHNYLKIPYQITKVFSPVLQGEPYRFMTSFSNKVTFKRDEIIKAEDFTHNAPIIEFG